MSEPNRVSPLLDGMAVGAPMSSRSGVQCCPAIRENSDEKYIVKILSFPASQASMDALLLTKAYKGPAEAMEYFKGLALDVQKDAQTLRELSALEGFWGYEGWQMVPMDKSRLGYEVFLLSPYRRSLEKFCRRHAVTHLEAVNLGLDLCAALAVCRRAGKLYVDLKPGNIFLSPEKEYRIGDLGFVPLDSLKYAAMPPQYISPYTAPEVRDLMVSLNDTVDIYAVGMILYEIYNGGKLPGMEDPAAPLPKPEYADEEMAEILLKACAPKPEDRWRSPIEMGQALVAYMQRNAINDTPIAPQEGGNAREAIPEDAPGSSQPSQEADMPEVILPPQPETDLRTKETWAIPPEAPPDTAGGEEPPQEAAPEEAPQNAAPVSDAPASPPPEEAAPAEPELPEASQAAPEDGEGADAFTQELEEVTRLLVPERKDPAEGPQQPSPEPKKAPVKKKPIRWKSLLATLLLILVLAAATVGGLAFYRFYYLQSVDSLSLEGTQNKLTVTVKTGADPSLISVTCTDVYGSVLRSGLVNGTAEFTGLTPGSLYKIQLEISGIHKLIGQISDVFTTESVTNIAGISTITGSESGSMMLSLTVEGSDPEMWAVTCSAEGEEDIVETFTGHSVTVRGLTVGTSYTVTLSATDNTLLSGQTQTEFTASPLVLAENLRVTSNSGGMLTLSWDAPEEPVERWTARCYGGDYDETQEVTDCEAVFTGISSDTAYTVEITALGMTQPARLSVTANPITVTAFHAEENREENAISVRWEYDGASPQGGWLLMYSIDGHITQNVEKCDGPSNTVTPLLPDAEYLFTVTSPDNVSIFDGEYSFRTQKAEIFSGHALSGYKITGKTLVTPEEEGWTRSSLNGDGYTDTFTLGQPISLVLRAGTTFYLDEEDTRVLCIIRGSDGKVEPSLVGEETRNWHDLWAPGDYRYCELDLPHVPDSPGSYTAEIYFDGMLAASVPFTVQ